MNSGIHRAKTIFKRSLLAFLLSTLLAIPLILMRASPSPALAEEPEPEGWAVIIGVTEYQCPLCIFDKEWNVYPVGVKHPDDDARDLALQLSPIIGENHINLLLNNEATNASIYYAIQWLAEKAGVNDTVLLYFCGHSAPQNLGTYDNFISDWQIADWLDKVNSQNVVVILDTCYAGSFRKELGQNGRVVLMGCQSDESSLEDRELKHGVFTHYILQAFSDFDAADTNHDYELSAKEIFDYAEPKTIDEIVAPFANLPTFSKGNVQHPTLYIPPYEFGEINLFMNAIFNTSANFPSDAIALTLDGKSYLPGELPASFIWLSGSAHHLNIPLQVNTGEGTRLAFTLWNDGNKSVSRTITQGGKYVANYTTQYKLNIESPYGNPKGAGWYDSDSSATISIDHKEGNIIQHVFTGWSGDLTEQETTALMTMNKPKTIKAEWETDCLRLYLLIFGFIALTGIIATVVIYINIKKKPL
ncbi:MAG: caspase family protein [Dehalococcoidia bacterium]|nr:caspase family protein [Dehalococcoidia bacterium]